jgi:cytochrome b pre-mRNA-processing protein 3
MVLERFFAPRPQALAGRALFQSAIQQARSPDLYQEGQAPDTPEGRFELYTAHVVLLLRRLAGGEAAVAEVRQEVFDAFVRNLDDGLREMGVGDLSVGKKMRRLAEAVYGRLRSYNEALAAGAEATALERLVGRTVLGRTLDADAGPLAAYVRRLEAALAAQPDDQLLRGEVRWPTFRG